jgi:hypothetical protein
MVGCTSMFASLPGIGEPDYVPPPPAVAPAYPAVHDMPPPRETKPLSEEERKELADELESIRDRQRTGTATSPRGRPARN